MIIVVGLVMFGISILMGLRLLIMGLREKKYHRLLWTVPLLFAVILFAFFVVTHEAKGMEPLSWLTVAGFVLLVSGMVAYLIIPRRLR